ncbi:MAG: hypothetical protein U9Q79_06300 [Candidatus Hydrogenedentes bacterium]|nr:hypothetical protein [Candidatus Hydrogenedentota bacterium]
MKIRALGVIIALCVAGTAVGGEMKFDRMSITKAPKVKITSGQWNMQGGVELTLFPLNPDEMPLKIKANEIVFAWDPGVQSGPEKVDLTGQVRVDGEIGVISSESASLDIVNDRLVFDQKVAVDSEQFSGLTASHLIYYLETGDIEMTDVTADRVPIEGMGGETEARDPMLLTVGDVKDWNGIIAAIKAQVAADSPSPGKRLISLLPEEARAQFNALAPDAQLTDDMKQDFVEQLNDVLEKKDFYAPAAWEGITLPEPVQALVNAKPEAGSELIKMNRGLFEAAYPQFIVAKVSQ